MIAIGIFKFFKSVIITWQVVDSGIEINKRSFLLFNDYQKNLKSTYPHTIDNIFDTTVVFNSKKDKYADFYSNNNIKKVSDLTASNLVSLKNPEVLRFTTLNPPIKNKSTLYNLTYLIGNDKFLNGSTNMDYYRKKMRLFKSLINLSLTDDLSDSSNLYCDTSPFYLKDFIDNFNSVSYRFYDNYKNQWLADDWSETYLPAAVEVLLYYADDYRFVGDPQKIANGKRLEFIFTIPTAHKE